MTEEYLNNLDNNEEKEIDLLELAEKLWKQRKKIIKWCACGAVLGLIIAFSIPKEYSTTVKLAPESNSSKSISGGLGALASMAGISAAASGPDAVYPTLYPDVVSSVPFTTSLFDVPIRLKEGDKTITLREFLEEDTKSPWWSSVMGLPFKLIGLLKGGAEKDAKDKKVDSFELTPTEDKLVQALNKRIMANVDAKTSVVTIDVQMQDPLVSAILADTVVSRLQEYITAYRTNKSRKDLEYAQKINEEAKDNYYKAQQRYADYQDRNQGLALYSAKTTSERLENEVSLAFNLYNQTAQQVQTAQAKVQETTPVYAIITPATVPVKPTSPKKALILVGFTFLAFVACAAWILFVQPLIETRRNQSFADSTISDMPENNSAEK